MAETQTPNSYLSMDIIFMEILPKLPVKSLARFKCVSKTFRSKISSREFGELYMLRCFIPNGNRLLILPGSRQIAAYDLDAPAPSPAAVFSWPRDDGPIIIIGSCHGLLCIVRNSARGSPLVLLNPFTGIGLDIGMPIKDSGKNFGFGFDPSSLGYKIVAVADLHNKRAVKTRVTWVYSVNSNSWRTEHTSLPVDSMLDSYSGVLINDHLLHWMFWSPSKKKRRIGCFDVCGDEWKDDVLLPHYYYEAGCRVSLFDIGVVDGRLFSLFERKEGRDIAEVCFFDVWVMEKYGVQDSWVKLMSIRFSEQLEGGVVPAAISRRTSEVLIRHRRSTKFYWYNRETDVITVAPFPEFIDRQAFVCQRSLVSLPGGRPIRGSR